MKIERFIPEKSSKALLIRYYEFFSEILKEAFPEDPKRSFEKVVISLTNTSRSGRLWRWMIRDRSDVIADAVLERELEGENKHIAEVDIRVKKEYRRNGLGTILLRSVYEQAVQENLKSIVFIQFSTQKDGRKFLEKLEAKLAQRCSINQLDLKEIDLDLMDNWVKKARERAREYKLEFWRNNYPDDSLEAFVRLYNDFWNSVPMDDLEVEKETISAQRLLNYQKMFLTRGWEQWIMVARHIPTGKLTGFTVMFYTGYVPDLINQDDTGVHTDHRNKGLGRWLKAAMIKKLIKEKPYIKKVRTENSVTNKPMLRINREMGFKYYYDENSWQIALSEIAGFLKRNIR